MNIVGICAAAIGAALLSLFLRQYGSEYSAVVAIVASVGLTAVLLKTGLPVIAEYFGLAELSGVDGAAVGIMLKALGISYITVFAADICTDAGQSSLASRVELAGRLCLAAMALPLVKRIIAIAAELIK